MTLTEKIKTINNKLVQKKSQYNLDRQIANISALSLRSIRSFTDPATIKKIYLLLGCELKKQIGIIGKVYQILDKSFSSNKDS